MDTISLSQAGAGFFARADVRTLLETQILPEYLPGCRWFGGKARQPQSFRVEELLPLGEGPEAPRLVLVRVTYANGAAETYQLPLREARGGEAPIATFADGAQLIEATADEGFRRSLIRLMARGETLAVEGAELRGTRGRALPENAEQLPSRALKVEQSNSSLLYGDHIFMKLFRKLEDGVNPDVEIIRFLNEQRQFEYVPPFGGTLELQRPGREPQVLALALGLIANKGDAWAQTLAAVRGFYERVLAAGARAEGLAVPGLFGTGEPSPQLVELAGPFFARVRQLGLRTGQTHLALALPTTEGAFAPEPFTAADQRELSEAVRASSIQLFAHLRQPHAAGEERGLVDDLLSRADEVSVLAETIAHREVRTARTRTHGDYHLGQVLDTGHDFVLIDFEGEPQRSLAERKKKRSPLRDVAGMLRSFHYAAHSGLGEFAGERARLTPWAELWSELMSRTFFQAWVETCAGACFLPAESADIELLLKAFLLEKAIYEVNYELNNRPTWVGIPLRGILQVLG
jgi:trehalose synthase-fused probable maltokinase